jgi:hypothetical protein
LKFGGTAVGHRQRGDAANPAPRMYGRFIAARISLTLSAVLVYAFWQCWTKRKKKEESQR